MYMYSWLLWFALSQIHLTLITAYHEVKIWSLFEHGNLTKETKYCGQEEKLLLRSNFSSFPQLFQYTFNCMSQITYSFVNCGCLIYFFSVLQIWYVKVWMDILKYFRESLVLPDNKSQLYLYILVFMNHPCTLVATVSYQAPPCSLYTS